MTNKWMFTPEQVKLINQSEQQIREWMDVEGLAQWIAKDLPMYEIILFGSRIKGNYHEDSDLDLIFHDSTHYGEWSEESYCQKAYETLLGFSETFKTYVSIPVRLDAMLSHYGIKGEYMGMVNRDSQDIELYEDATSGWDYGDIPYYFKIDADGLSFQVLEGCEDMVFEDNQFEENLC